MNGIFFAKVIALIFLFEGIMPFLSPARWRETMLQLAQFNDRQIRIAGLISMLGGVLLLYLIHHGWDVYS